MVKVTDGVLEIMEQGEMPSHPLKKKRTTKSPVLKSFENIYNKVESMLTPEQKTYYEKVFRGQVKFDPIRHGELFMLLFTIYATNVINEAIDTNRVSKDIADTIAQYRQGLKDMDDMMRRREDAKAKERDEGIVADATRESSESRLDEFIKRVTESKSK